MKNNYFGFNKILTSVKIIVILGIYGSILFLIDTSTPSAQAQTTPWSGVLDSTRAIDWSQVGVTEVLQEL